MKFSEIENRISTAFSEETPDLSARIIEECENTEQVSAPIGITPADISIPKKKGIKIGRICAIAAMFLLMFAVGLVFGNLAPITFEGDTASIYLDINPSIELVVREDGTIKECIAGNTDAETVLAGMNLRGVELSTAINAVIGSMYINGYITDVSNSILVSSNSKSAKFDGLLQTIVTDVNSIMEKANLPCSIIARDINVNDNLSSLAQQNGVSVGKMSLINKIIERIYEYGIDDIDDLAEMSIRELYLIYAQAPTENPDIGGFGRPDIDDDDDEDEFTSGRFDDYIDREDAIEIVLDILGVDEDDVRTARAYAMPTIDGKMVYNVGVYYGGKMYEYHVDCKSGVATPVSEKDAPSYEHIFPDFDRH